MSRKSERLHGRRMEESEQISPAILNRKRKHESECEESKENIAQAMDETSENNRLQDANSSWLKFRSVTRLPMSPMQKRESPLPTLSWADPQEVWDFMLLKDTAYKRDVQALERHPALQSKMRSILLDWLIEVCEVYRLHRDTYHLAMDFIDRFLANQRNMPKQLLQLVGITALFVAAKIEEIYPPKLSEFAYVTDGACTEQDIVSQEIVMLQSLNWDLSPVTAFGWLNVFVQLINLKHIDDTSNNFVFPNYSAAILTKVSQLMDLCMLDINSLQFPYSVITTAALSHFTSLELSCRVSGYKWNDVHECIQWMVPFAEVIREMTDVAPKHFKHTDKEDFHRIQTHDVDLQMLEKVQQRQFNSDPCRTPLTMVATLTPPSSNEKFQDVI